MEVKRIFSPAHLECVYPYFGGLLCVVAYIISGHIIGHDKFCDFFCMKKISEGVLMYSSVMSALLASLFAMMFGFNRPYMKVFRRTIQFLRLKRFMAESVIVNLLITIIAIFGIGFNIQSLEWEFWAGAVIVALFGISVLDVIRLLLIVNKLI